ncbi:hypothetical protein Bca52824_081448 [Brassica carinata]|uniref:RING-type E3 ubiquitin transferase n=1 Tax=Brassica carinata TaxID=52824 RepID=A0A8X7TR94_BRACI|nr:hypothetical protein Bca52824_081448 [Brassica carinata]
MNFEELSRRSSTGIFEDFSDKQGILEFPRIFEDNSSENSRDFRGKRNSRNYFRRRIRRIASNNDIRRNSAIFPSRILDLLGFGLRLSLFEDAERLVSDASEKKHLKSCIEQAKEQLTEVDHQPTVRSQGYLFEGHLTVDREPPQPQCLVQQNLMSAFSSIVAGESSNAADELINGLDNIISGILEDGGPPRAPLASKEVVKKLLVIVFSEEMLKTLGAEVECCICKENLHTFRPLCLKPWLDEHNSCPICRHELPTDDQKYESWKEREKEAEEERKGA